MLVRNLPVNDQKYPFGESYGFMESCQPVRSDTMCLGNMLDVFVSSCGTGGTGKDLECWVEAAGRSRLAEQLRSDVTAGQPCFQLAGRLRNASSQSEYLYSKFMVLMRDLVRIAGSIGRKDD
jgi:hypothetical protein